jgi:hypothetical protein
MGRVQELVGASPEDLVFVYDQPSIEDGGRVVLLRYAIESRVEGVAPISFTETVTLPEAEDAAPVDDAFRRVARLLALVGGLSYFKTTVPATVRVPDGLTADERGFLAAVIRGGLGEFAYRNDLPGALEPVIEAPERPEHVADPGTPARGESALVAIGGGKDSIVALEALRRTGVDVRLFSVNSYEPIRATAEVAGLPLLTARRELDPLLFELNEAGAHNGHVPVTAVNSLIGCLTALRSGLGAVVFSNEASSSYGNLRWGPYEVNHQWSKGLEFEELLRARLTGTGVEYVSLLRPLTELAIMRRFATETAYHSAFTSCNRAFHLDEQRRRSWCGTCPKCLFVFLLLAPFTTQAALLRIFGQDLFQNPDNEAGFLDLLGVGDGHKPFECVGEPSECRAAVVLLRDHPDWAEHPFLQSPGVADVEVDESALAELFTFSDRHLLGGALEKAAREVL